MSVSVSAFVTQKSLKGALVQDVYCRSHKLLFIPCSIQLMEPWTSFLMTSKQTGWKSGWCHCRYAFFDYWMLVYFLKLHLFISYYLMGLVNYLGQLVPISKWEVPILGDGIKVGNIHSDWLVNHSQDLFASFKALQVPERMEPHLNF